MDNFEIYELEELKNLAEKKLENLRKIQQGGLEIGDRAYATEMLVIKLDALITLRCRVSALKRKYSTKTV